MDIMEIVLLLAGGIVFILSFLIPARKEESSEEAKGLAKEQIKALVSEELEAVRGHVDDVVEEAVTYSIEKTERSLERLSNEKIMAVNEYSDTVLSEIHKNHEEVMFLYDMLNDKHANLKNTVSEINRTVKEAKETKKEAEEVVNTFQRLAPDAVLPLKANQVEISPVSAAAQRMNGLQAAPAASRGAVMQQAPAMQQGTVPANTLPQRGAVPQGMNNAQTGIAAPDPAAAQRRAGVPSLPVPETAGMPGGAAVPQGKKAGGQNPAVGMPPVTKQELNAAASQTQMKGSPGNRRTSRPAQPVLGQEAVPSQNPAAELPADKARPAGTQEPSAVQPGSLNVPQPPARIQKPQALPSDRVLPDMVSERPVAARLPKEAQKSAGSRNSGATHPSPSRAFVTASILDSSKASSESRSYPAEPVQTPGRESSGLQPYGTEPAQTAGGESSELQPYVTGTVQTSGREPSGLQPYGAEAVQTSGRELSGLSPYGTEPAQTAGGESSELQPYVTGTVQMPGGELPELQPYVTGSVQTSGREPSGLQPYGTEPAQTAGGELLELQSYGAEAVQAAGGELPGEQSYPADFVQAAGRESSALQPYPAEPAQMSGRGASELQPYPAESVQTSVHELSELLPYVTSPMPVDPQALSGSQFYGAFPRSYDGMPVTAAAQEMSLPQPYPGMPEPPYGQNPAPGSDTALPGAIHFLQEIDGRERNYNDRIMELHKNGKSNVAIAKELNLGVGEVKLVIDLFKNRSEK